jgi:hypothetical protein
LVLQPGRNKSIQGALRIVVTLPENLLHEADFGIGDLRSTQTLGFPTERGSAEGLLTLERLKLYANGMIAGHSLDLGSIAGWKWSALLPGGVVRGFKMIGGNLVARTVKTKVDRLSGGWVPGPATERQHWVGYGYSIVDVHPTRGDLVLLKVGTNTRIIQMLPRKWRWIPDPETTFSSNPLWTRLGFRDPRKLEDAGFEETFPFEFWDGTLYGLNPLGIPVELEGA